MPREDFDSKNLMLEQVKDRKNQKVRDGKRSETYSGMVRLRFWEGRVGQSISTINSLPPFRYNCLMGLDTFFL